MGRLSHGYLASDDKENYGKVLDYFVPDPHKLFDYLAKAPGCHPEFVAMALIHGASKLLEVDPHPAVDNPDELERDDSFDLRAGSEEPEGVTKSIVGTIVRARAEESRELLDENIAEEEDEACRELLERVGQGANLGLTRRAYDRERTVTGEKRQVVPDGIEAALRAEDWNALIEQVSLSPNKNPLETFFFEVNHDYEHQAQRNADKIAEALAGGHLHLSDQKKGRLLQLLPDPLRIKTLIELADRAKVQETLPWMVGRYLTPSNWRSLLQAISKVSNPEKGQRLLGYLFSSQPLLLKELFFRKPTLFSSIEAPILRILIASEDLTWSEEEDERLLQALKNKKIPPDLKVAIIEALSKKVKIDGEIIDQLQDADWRVLLARLQGTNEANIKWIFKALSKERPQIFLKVIARESISPTLKAKLLLLTGKKLLKINRRAHLNPRWSEIHLKEADRKAIRKLALRGDLRRFFGLGAEV